MPVRRPVCLICFVFLFVILIVTGGGSPAPTWDVDSANGRTVSVVGKIADRQEKNGTYQLFLKNISFKADQAYFPKHSKGIVVKLTDSGQDINKTAKIGAMIEVRGVFAPFDAPRCEGMFDSRSYYLIRGYDGQLKRARIIGVSKGYDRIPEYLRMIRDRAYKILSDNMSEEDAGLVAAMTLGDKTGLDTEIKELYQHAGISHVLALSGLHIASVGLALVMIMQKAGMSKTPAGLVSFFMISVYAVMTGMSTSTQRAMIMFGLFIASGLFGRTYDLLSGASVSAMVILAVSPEYIYDSGFLLSFGAVTGIACVYPILVVIPSVIFKTKGSKVADNGIYRSLCISLSVMIVTLPVVADNFMQVAIFSVVINIVVVPLMGVVLFTGFAGMITGFTGIDPSIIFKITHYILRFYRLLAETSEKIDGNILVTGRPQKWQIITHAIITVIAVITGNSALCKKEGKQGLIDRISRRISLDNGHHVKNIKNKITYIIEKRSDMIKWEKKKITIALVTPVIFLISAVILTVHPREDLEIRNVDVGQGDCALIWGDDIPTVMIDGGSTDIKQPAKYRIVPVLKANRVTVIDCCFLSHMDSDHVNAVIEMLEDSTCVIKLKTIYVSCNVVSSDEETENYARLKSAAAKKRVRIKPISAGDVIGLGDMRAVCLSPEKGRRADANDDSVVLMLLYPYPDNRFTALFTGDIGEETERRILDDLRKVSYLKVAHHGSRFSSCDDFLRKAGADVSVISAGVGNSYGHPHAETLERLTRTGTRIYRTDLSGEVIVTVSGEKVYATTVLAR